MEIQYTLYLILAPLTIVLSLITAVYAWRANKSTRTKIVTAFMVLICGWLLTNTIELASMSEAGTVFWAQTTYIFFNGGMIAWFLFATRYADIRLPKWGHPLISGIPVATVILVFTNEFHHWIWQSYTFHQGSMYLFMKVKYGPWFWVQAAYLYTLIIIGAVFIFSRYFQSFRIFRQRSNAVVIGVTLPLLTNFIYITKLFPGFQMDYSAISFALAGVFFAWGAFRSRSIELSPVALNKVINQIGDGLMVIDQRGRVIAANPASLQIVGKTEAQVFGQPVDTVLQNWEEMFAKFKLKPEHPYEFTLQSNKQQRHFECKISDLVEEKKSQIAGQVIVLHEITERVQLLNAVHEMARKDPLTGIANRRYFFEEAEKELARAARYRRNLSIVIIDIDRFKTVNDTFGHQVGDQALKSLTSLCKKNLRMVDLFARYGGEEFVILMPETSTQAAEKAVERLRRKIEKHSLSLDSDDVAMTVSIGIAHTTGDPNLSIDQLLEQADKALYNAKLSGRNQIAIWSPKTLEPVG